MANGRLLKAFRDTVLVCVVVTGAVAFAATVGYGLIFWPLVYPENLPTKEVVVNAALISAACVLGGLRWAYEMISITMWILVRIPKISAGLEGDRYWKLVKIAIIFTIFRWFTEGVMSALSPLFVLVLTRGLNDKSAAFYDRYREPVIEAVEPQTEPLVSV